MGETGHWWHVIPVFAAIAVTSMASYAVLAEPIACGGTSATLAFAL
jgi:hypothetical protein